MLNGIWTTVLSETGHASRIEKYRIHGTAFSFPDTAPDESYWLMPPSLTAGLETDWAFALQHDFTQSVSPLETPSQTQQGTVASAPAELPEDRAAIMSAEVLETALSPTDLATLLPTASLGLQDTAPSEAAGQAGAATAGAANGDATPPAALQAPVVAPGRRPPAGTARPADRAISGSGGAARGGWQRVAERGGRSFVQSGGWRTAGESRRPAVVR